MHGEPQHDDAGMRRSGVSGPEDPRPGADWDAFRAARDRFFAQVRAEAMEEPPRSVCPDVAPDDWTADRRGASPERG